MPGATSTPSTEKFSESASELNRTPLLHHRAVRRAAAAAVDADPVKATVSCSVKQVEQTPGPAGDQLQAALGQQSGSDDLLHHGLGQVGRLRGGFDHGGHAGQEGRAELLQHSPDREVEGVDLQRNPTARRVDVLADELTRPAEPFSAAPSTSTVAFGSSRRPLLA